MVTFDGFSCVPGSTIVVIRCDSGGLYFACADGNHYLESQVDQNGDCLGLTALI